MPMTLILPEFLLERLKLIALAEPSLPECSPECGGCLCSHGASLTLCSCRCFLWKRYRQNNQRRQRRHRYLAQP